MAAYILVICLELGCHQTELHFIGPTAYESCQQAGREMVSYYRAMGARRASFQCQRQ